MAEDKHTIDNLLKRISQLESENRKLKDELYRLKTSEKTFYTLKEDVSAYVDLGKITEKLPTAIPDHMRWKANEYPKDWEPERKVKEYLMSFWNNYPVTQSYFSNVKGGQAFYKYLKRNNLLYMLPTTFQLKLKQKIES